MAKVLLIFLFVPLNAFIINNKYINEDGLKVFTVSNEIKHNNCSCACNCLNEQLPLDKPLQAPAPPISNAPKQFIIKKVIHNNDCNCACSCVPNELDEQIQTTTPRQFNDVQNGILEELKTTIEESIALTTKPINSPTPKQQLDERLIETTTQQYWTTTESEYNTEAPTTTTGYRTAPPQTAFEYKTKLETTTGYATGPPQQTTDQRSGFWPDPSSIPLTNGHSLQSLFNSFSTTPAPFTLPPIKWPFPPITNPFSQPSPSTVQPTNSQTNLWSQPWQTWTQPSPSTVQPANSQTNLWSQPFNTWTQPSPWTQQSVWPSSLEQKTRNTGTTGQNAWTQTWWPSSAGTSGSTNQPTSNTWQFTTNQNVQTTNQNGQTTNQNVQTTNQNGQTTNQNVQTTNQNSQTTSNPWSSRSNQQTTNQNSQTSSNLPEINVDNELPTQSTNQFTSNTFSESQTTNDAGRQSTSFWTKTPAKEKDFVPGLEISPGGIDSSFTKSVAITSTKLNSSPATNPPQQVSGDTQRSTTVAIKSPSHFTAELNDQPATTVQQHSQQANQLSPDFKEKVQTLLERLKQQLQKMRTEEAAKQTEETTLQPEDRDEKLDEMRVDLQQILANNSINEETAVTDEVQNEDGTTKASDRKELMQKLHAIRGMLDKMKTRTTTAEPTTQASIQTTLAPIVEQTITDLLTTVDDTTTLTPNVVTQVNVNVAESSTQQSITSEEPITITPNIVTQSQTNEAETSTITFTEASVVTTTSNQEFLNRLHEKLMNLKTKLDEMRQQMSQTTNIPVDATTQTVVEKEEDRPDFNQLHAQLANIKNSLVSSEDIQKLENDVKNEQAVRKKMQETLDTLKQELNRMQNEQRTTLSIGLSSAQTTTPINKVIETSTSVTKEQKINVDFDGENTPESATREAISQPNVDSTSTPTTLTDVKKLITELESTIHLETTTQLTTKLTTKLTTQFNEDTSASPVTTQAPTLKQTTKSILPEAETEARQSTDKLITVGQASPSISVTVIEEKQTEPISTTSPVQQSTTPEISGPAFVQQIDASEEQSSLTTSAPTKALNSETPNTATPITTLKPVQTTTSTTLSTKSNQIRRKPENLQESDSNSKFEPLNRRGLEITRMLRPIQATKSSQIDFNRDDNEDDESFTDLGSTEKELVVTKPQKTTVLPTKPVVKAVVKSVAKAKSVEELSWEESRERTRKPHRERTKILSFETEEDGDDVSEERPLRTKRPKARRRKPTIQSTTQSTTIQTTSTTQQAETTKHWIYEHNQQKTVQEARLKLIDTIINSSSRLIGEAMRNTNNANLPQLAAPGEPFGIESRSQVPLVKSPSPTDALRSKDIENWIRRNPQKVAENEPEPTKPNARALPNTTGNERSLGFTPSTDTQLFSFIDKLMKIRPPETDSNLKPPAEPADSFKAPSAKPISRIRTPEQFVQIPKRMNERKQVEVRMTTTEQETQKPVTQRPRKGKNSDEFYDDYQNHDPTLAPDVPTRTPRIQQQFVTTIENRPQLEEKPDNSFSVDVAPSILPQNEETIATTTPTRKTQFSDEATLIQRLEEARRLREKLEKTQLEESVANDGIHFQSNLERRHQIEAKLAKLAEAERWHRTLLERAQLNKQLHGNVDKSKTHALRDGEVRVAPTAKPVQTTLLSSSTTVQNGQSTIPKHCHPVLKFVEMYNVTEPKSWIHENCQRIKQFYPNTSCEQIEELLAVCFAKQTK